MQEKLALDILVVTSTNDLHALKGVLGEKGVKDDAVTGVTYAATPLHGAKVYSLGGVRTPDGRVTSFRDLGNLVSASPETLGSYPIPQGEVTDPTAVAAWWYLANGRYDAVQQIEKLAKKSGPVGEQVSALMERVHAHLQQRYDAISLPITDIATYDAAKELYTDLDAAGLREFSEQEKALKSALKDAERDDALAEELKAWSGYRTCMEMLSSGRPKEVSQALVGFKQLGEMMPGTEYGRRARERAEAYH